MSYPLVARRSPFVPAPGDEILRGKFGKAVEMTGVHDFEIGRLSFDPRTGRLRARAATARLEPKAAAVLGLLCAADGGLVTRQDLLDRCGEGEIGRIAYPGGGPDPARTRTLGETGNGSRPCRRASKGRPARAGLTIAGPPLPGSRPEPESAPIGGMRPRGSPKLWSWPGSSSPKEPPRLPPRFPVWAQEQEEARN